MKTYLLHHTPASANQDTWCVSFSLPFIASRYACAGTGVWYVESWLTADQIKRRLSVLFDSPDELRVQALGREEAALNPRLTWLEGRLEDDDSLTGFSAPRMMWEALQSAFEGLLPDPRQTATSYAVPAMAATPRNSRAA